MRRLPRALLVLAALGAVACPTRQDSVPPTASTRVTSPSTDEAGTATARPGEFQVQVDQFATRTAFEENG